MSLHSPRDSTYGTAGVVRGPLRVLVAPTRDHEAKLSEDAAGGVVAPEEPIE